MQHELTQAGSLLDAHGDLSQVGWSRQPLLDCNLENANFYRLPFFQRFRIKRWDYYAVFTPQRFFSATIADLGYAGNIFVYTLDFSTHVLHEEGLVIPLGSGINLPRNSLTGETTFANKQVQLRFQVLPEGRHITVLWPNFHQGRGISADILFHQPAGHESMTITIPIGKRRFYYNRKINCLPAEGFLQYGDVHETLSPHTSLGSLDWGRGVWEYRSTWNWASASAYLPTGQLFGLNIGSGFGDLSAATENCLVLDGKIHKLEQVDFKFDSNDFMRPWEFLTPDNRLELDFVPFTERLARTNLGLIMSEVHQMFGTYNGWVISDPGDRLTINGLIGFAEHHEARW